MANLEIHGLPTPERLYLIEEAIGRIQVAPEEALRTEYLGIKRYAHFGDQRCDCSYGLGPTHGSIVFSIERTKRDRPLDSSDIDLLLRVRDFGVKEIPPVVVNLLPQRSGSWNYCHAITLRNRLRTALEAVQQQIDAIETATYTADGSREGEVGT